MTTLKQSHDRDEWDDYVLESNGHPLQLWGWGEVKAAHDWKACRVQLHDDTGVVGVAQILIKRLPWPLKSIAYIPRGPVVDEDNREDFLKSLADYVKHHYRSVVLSIEPDSETYRVPQGWRKSNNRILPPETIILDLNKSEDDLMKEMAKKTRQYIRKSSTDVQIKRARSKDELAKCLEIYHETAKRAKFAVHPDAYYYDVHEKLGECSQVFGAYVEGELVAFLWVAISSDVAFELYGGVNDRGQELRANYALKWHAITKCKEWGLTRYDFGGLIDGGVSTFKLGWADGKTELVGTYDRPLSVWYFIWDKCLPTAKKILRLFK